MKIIFLLFVFFSLSCTLLPGSQKTGSQKSLEKKHEKQAKKTQTQSSAIKKNKKKQKVSFEKKTINKAKKQILSGSLTRGQIKQLKKILKSDKTDFKDPVRMILGQSFFKKSSLKKALFYYSQVEENPYKAQALLQTAKIYHQINKPKKTRRALELFWEAEPSTPQLLLESHLLELSLLSNNPSPDPIELLKTYCHILNYENKNNSLYRDKAKRIIFQINENKLLDIRSEDFIEPVKDLVLFRAGKILFHRGKFKKSYFLLKKFLRFSSESALEEKALKYLQAINSRKKVKPKHIGAILPLSGPSAPIGQRSLKGLKMGLGFYANKGNSFKLTVLDSEGQADKTRKAVQTLIIKHHVIAIVGGVLSRTASALAEETQNFGAPAILMSQKSEITQTGHYVFQNSLTAHQVAGHLVEYLIDELNIKKFAILYPNDPYGVDYANAFWSKVEQKGGKIKGAQFYKPGETDFNGPIRRLTGLYYLKDRIKEYKSKLSAWYLKTSSLSKRRAPVTKNILLPIIDFEVLFIPDSLKTLSLIAPHIAYNDIKNIKLAGPSLWNQEKILKKHSKYIDNIVFPDPGLSSDRFKQSSFYKQFNRAFDQKPGLFEVLAYESALALNQVISTGANTRRTLREDLANLKSFSGPLGKISISKKREFLRPLNILKMEKNILSSAKPL